LIASTIAIDISFRVPFVLKEIPFTVLGGKDERPFIVD
jgi:hypothetical protein